MRSDHNAVDGGADTWVAEDIGTRVTQAIVCGLFVFLGSIFLLNLFVAVLNIEYVVPFLFPCALFVSPSCVWLTKH